MSSSAAFRVFTRAAMPFLGASVAARAALLMADEAVWRKMKTVLIEFCDCGWRLCVCVWWWWGREREREKGRGRKRVKILFRLCREIKRATMCVWRGENDTCGVET